MRVFLAGIQGSRKSFVVDATEGEPFILESFFYADADTERLLPRFGDFMLDSGAFTFMGGFSFTSNQKVKVEFEDYLRRYADFINRNHVEKFFELDVDSVVGYEKVIEYRATLERLTGRQCIPVWHSTRGKEDFLRCCEEYPYVALGGIVGGEWSARAEKFIPWFISEAHKRKAKIHGLGYTKLEKLKQYHFDSVDSTAWVAGSRFGFVYYFDGRTMQKVQAPTGYRIGDSRAAAVNNFSEWLKFQKWAVNHL